MIPGMNIPAVPAGLHGNLSSASPGVTPPCTLRDRFREDHMGLTASSLTFTTSRSALVPFFTVAAGHLHRLPDVCDKLQGALQAMAGRNSLIPDNIARQVLGYLTSSRQARPTSSGVAGLAFSAGHGDCADPDHRPHPQRHLAGEETSRPLAQRVLIYWAAITLGRWLLAASLAVTASYVASGSTRHGGPCPWQPGFSAGHCCSSSWWPGAWRPCTAMCPTLL
jgi:membrane protein